MAQRGRTFVVFAAAALTGLAGLAGLAACAGRGGVDGGFDAAAYCEAIAQPGIVLDAKLLIDGDEAATADAIELYTSIAEQAPAELADEWALLIREADTMWQTARGDRAVADSNFEGFTEAFSTIQRDRQERCPAG
ncbi:MAG: hypothetical protein LBD97_02995 [Bifidobacteriaceae bacterium]|jgi:hypothetical protein|nr:hypothetical protein [Bifidobacteriaceae bacterium]